MTLKYVVFHYTDLTKEVKDVLHPLIQIFAKKADFDLKQLYYTLIYNPSSFVYLIFKKKRVTGFLHLVISQELEKEGNVVYISALSNAGNSHIGSNLNLFKRLLAHIKRNCVRNGIKRIVFNTTRLGRFWEVLGFKLNSYNYEQILR